MDKLLKKESFTVSDHSEVGIQLGIPWKKILEIQLKASQQQINHSEIALTMMLDYWLKEVIDDSQNLLDFLDKLNGENLILNQVKEIFLEISQNFPNGKNNQSGDEHDLKSSDSNNEQPTDQCK